MEAFNDPGVIETLDAVMARLFDEAARCQCEHGVSMVELCGDCILESLEAADYVEAARHE
jgi:hypothetical protein